MSDKSILITGCSTGIGYDAAHGLTRAGWRVFATCRAETDCERLRGEGLESLRLDYTDEASITAAVSEILARTGGTLDAVFNNGGYACPGAVEDVPTAALRANFEVNLFGYHELTRQVIPVMRKQGYGRIVNCSSVLGFVGRRWRGAYVATKFAMEGLTDVLRMEMADTPIRIILIEPGPITSDFRKNAIRALEHWVDWKSSARVGQYQAVLDRYHKQTGPDPFELPASAVTAKLLRALQAPRPKARYYVTTPTYLMAFARRILPGRALDWMLSKG